MRAFTRAAATVACILALLLSSLGSVTAQTDPSQNGQFASYIVQLAPGTPLNDVISQKLAEHQGRVSHRYSSAINGFAISLPPVVAQALASDKRVVAVMADPVVHASTQVVPTGVERIGTLENQDAKIDGVDERVNINVAVLDTGVGPHPDLNVVGGVDCTGGNNYNDQHGHGTHVAGTIGALDNTAGVVGVAPGARIWAVKVLGADGKGSGSSILCGIDWVTKNLGTTGIKVANMSLGGTISVAPDNNCGKTNKDTIHQAICASVAAGVTYTVAAGNDGKDAKDYFPARYPEVITVSALVDTDGKPGGLGPSTSVGADDRLASFSNYGAVVNVIAPGVGIRSTVLNGGYANYNGTSMAAPHVAGAAALYLVANPGSTPAQVLNALIATGSTSAWSGDKDSFKEPLISVSSGQGSIPPQQPTPTPSPTPTPTPTPDPQVRDAEVVSISAPTSVTQGGTVTVSAVVRNNGTAAETVSVSFSESPGGAKGSTSVQLAAGASATVSFKWTTTSSTKTGSHTITVSASVPNDSTSTNNAKSRSITVNAPAKNMSVSAMTVSSAKTTAGWTITTKVTVKSGTASVSGATVTIRYTDPNGALVTATATTNSSGVATFTRSVKTKGTYTVRVNSITKSGFSYLASGNVVSSRSVTLK